MFISSKWLIHNFQLPVLNLYQFSVQNHVIIDQYKVAFDTILIILKPLYLLILLSDRFLQCTRTIKTLLHSKRVKEVVSLVLEILRITVYDVLSWLAQGMKPEEIVDDFPELNLTDISACLFFAAERERLMTIVA